MKCYFCGKEEKIVPEKRKLWNGKMVNQCVWCCNSLTRGLVIAKEKGYFDPLQNSGKPITGGDSMQVKKGAVGGSNLKASFVEERKITSLKITNEGEYVTYKPRNDGEKETTKLVLGVEYDGITSSDPNKWSMNNKSMNALIDKWGDDTAVWVGKAVEINIAGEKEYRHIVVDEMRTK